MSPLNRSGNNVSLIYVEYFFSYLLVPNFINQWFLVSRYNNKGIPKEVGVIYVVFIHEFCAVQLAVDKHRYNRDFMKNPVSVFNWLYFFF